MAAVKMAACALPALPVCKFLFFSQLYVGAFKIQAPGFLDEYA
jgi:hypothetical protein